MAAGPIHDAPARRARWPAALGGLALAALLGATFAAYLRPGMVLDFATLLAACGLR